MRNRKAKTKLSSCELSMPTLVETNTRSLTGRFGLLIKDFILGRKRRQSEF